MNSGDEPYRIELAASARRALHRLPAKTAAAIIEFITGPLAADPHRFSKPLVNRLSAYRSASRGDYRVLIRIDEAKRRVLVAYVDHRADVYRRR